MRDVRKRAEVLTLKKVLPHRPHTAYDAVSRAAAAADCQYTWHMPRVVREGVEIMRIALIHAHRVMEGCRAMCEHAKGVDPDEVMAIVLEMVERRADTGRTGDNLLTLVVRDILSRGGEMPVRVEYTRPSPDSAIHHGVTSSAIRWLEGDKRNEKNQRQAEEREQAAVRAAARQADAVGV